MPEEPAADSLEELENLADEPESSEVTDDDPDFSWDDNEGEEGQEEGADESDNEGEEDEHAFDLGEETQIPAAIHGELGGLAKELGIPGNKAAELLNKGLEVYQAQFKEQNRQLGRELKKEWGKDFDARMKATKAFAARLGREAGLKAADMGVMMSPYGIRLLDAMRSKLSESGGFAGRTAGASKMSREERLDAFYADKDKMAAVLDVSHPMHASVNKELNELHGIDD